MRVWSPDRDGNEHYGDRDVRTHRKLEATEKEGRPGDTGRRKATAQGREGSPTRGLGGSQAGATL